MEQKNLTGSQVWAGPIAKGTLAKAGRTYTFVDRENPGERHDYEEWRDRGVTIATSDPEGMQRPGVALASSVEVGRPTYGHEAHGTAVVYFLPPAAFDDLAAAMYKADQSAALKAFARVIAKSARKR